MPPKNKDSFFNLKFMGYCMAFLPPEEKEGGNTFEDFVRYAKFQLCMERQVLMEDAVWDKYTDEQILVEYYALFFTKNKKEKEEFEGKLAGATGDIYDWFDQQIAQNQKEMEEKASQLDDSVRFTPDALGDN